MIKQLFLSLAFLCCGYCNANEQPQYSLVVTIDPGESVLVKTADGKSSIFIDYNNKPIGKGIGIDSPRAYCVEYHLMIWTQCPLCNCYYDLAHHNSCPNGNCPSQMQ